MFSTPFVIVALLPILALGNHLFYCTEPKYTPSVPDVLDANFELNAIAATWGNKKVKFSRAEIPATEGYRVPAYITRFGISTEPETNIRGAILIDLVGPTIESETTYWSTVATVARDIIVRCIIGPVRTRHTTAGCSTIGDTNSLYVSVTSLQGLKEGLLHSSIINPPVRRCSGDLQVGGNSTAIS